MFEHLDACYITMRGATDPESVAAFRREVELELSRKPRELVIFDLSELATINSLLLGVLTQIWRSPCGKDAAYRLIVRKSVMDLIRISRLDRRVGVYTREETPV